MPEDYFRAMKVNNFVQNKAIKEFGIRYFLKRRCYMLHHISLAQTIKMIWKTRRMAPEMEKNFDIWFKEEKVEK